MLGASVGQRRGTIDSVTLTLLNEVISFNVTYENNNLRDSSLKYKDSDIGQFCQAVGNDEASGTPLHE